MIFDLYFGVERKFQGGISQIQILAGAADICVPPKLCGFQFKAKCAGCKPLKGGIEEGGGKRWTFSPESLLGRK